MVLVLPAGNPRFGRATIQPPAPSGTSSCNPRGGAECPWAMATLMELSVGWIHPVATSHTGPRRGTSSPRSTST
jgi:hypothetical protein